MDTVFIDSDSFIALNDTSDTIHEQAIQLNAMLHEKKTALFTGTNVLMEVATILSQRVSHKKAVEFLQLIRQGVITVIHPDKRAYICSRGNFLQTSIKKC